MRRSKFSESQIVAILKQQEAGIKVATEEVEHAGVAVAQCFAAQLRDAEAADECASCTAPVAGAEHIWLLR